MTALVADALELLNEKGTDTSTSKRLLHTHEDVAVRAVVVEENAGNLQLRLPR